MDFNSLGQGSPFYILRKIKGEKPVLEIGVVKGKTNPTSNYNAQAMPGAFAGMNHPYVASFTVGINGSDRVIPDIPVNLEMAARGNETYSSSKEGILQAVDNMVQESKTNIANHPYDEMCIVEGEKMVETLNPRYAEEKAQARTIVDLQNRVNNQDKKLDEMKTMMDKILTAVGSK